MTNTNDIYNKAMEISIKKSKIHEKNLYYHINEKFINNDIDIKYVDIIKEFIKSSSITTRMKNIEIFENFIINPFIQNRFYNKTKEDLLNDSYFQYRYKKESKLFNKTYDDIEPSNRIKYGSINIKNLIEGDENSKSYGDISIFYKNEIKNRCTFTYGNSEETMMYICTYDYFLHLLYHMPINDIKLIIELIEKNESKLKMKTYIEVQIHGSINILSDIEKITLPYNLYKQYENKIKKFNETYPQIEIQIY
jgi:hypothetical protein